MGHLPKNGWVMAKTYMPIYGIIGLFRDFWPITWPKINMFQWNEVYSISTTKLHILFKCQLNISKNMDSMAKKPQKSAVSPFALFAQTQSLI